MAYIVGYLTADGCVKKGNGPGYRLHLVSCDKDLIDYCIAEFGSTYAVQSAIGGTPHRQMCYRSSIGDQQLIMDLMALGVLPNKTENPILPIVPEDCLADFARGLFDGDGSVTYGHYANFPDRIIVDIISSSKPFLHQFGMRLKDKIGVVPKIHAHGNNYTLRYGCAESVALYRYMYTGGFCLQRKKDKFEAFLAKKGQDWCYRACNLCGVQFTVLHDKSYRCWNCKKALKRTEQEIVQAA